MEITKGERIRLGIFLVVGLSALVGILLFYIGKQLMIERTPFYTRFSESVAGLNPGAKVKWNGVAVGQVTALAVDSLHLNQVVVHFEVEPGTPIKPSVRANMVGGLSLTGLKSIELTGGVSDEANLEAGQEVLAGTSQLKQLTGQAETIILKTETLMNQLVALTSETNQANLSSSLRSISRITANLDLLLNKNRGSLDSMITHAQTILEQGGQIAHEARQVMDETHQMMADVQQQIQGLQLDQRVDQVTQSVERALQAYETSGKSLNEAIEKMHVQQTVEGLQAATQGIETAAKRADLVLYKAQDDFTQTMRHLKEAAENMADFSRLIRENPSLLFRNSEKEGRER